MTNANREWDGKTYERCLACGRATDAPCGGLDGSGLGCTNKTRAPAASVGDAPSDAVALANFTEYFVKNYPGPDTIISDPNWHAPRIFRAAKHALRYTAPPAAPVVSDAVRALVPKWRADAAKLRKAGGRAQRRNDPADAEAAFTGAQDADSYADELTAALRKPGADA